MASLRVCAHQVGGHMTNDTTPDTLVDGEGAFYKPYQAGERNVREAAFYILLWGAQLRTKSGTPVPVASVSLDTASNGSGNGNGNGGGEALVVKEASPAAVSEHPWGQGPAYEGAQGTARPEDLAGLRAFIPESYGVALVGERHYLVLEDVCHHYKQPCVLDLKVGFTTLYEWAPQAYQDKCRQKDGATTQHSLGFRMSGMQYYKRSEGVMHKVERQFGRKLTDATMPPTLAEFAGELGPAQLYGAPGAGVLARLAPIRQWFESQRSFQFFQASLLITYEGEAASVEDADVQVHLIDFAHTFPSNGGQDSNFLRGLDSVIAILTSLATAAS